MTDAPRRLTEPGLLARRRDRAMGLGFAGGADVLWRRAAEGVAERLGDVTRDFPEVVLHGTGAGAVARALPAGTGAARLLQIDASPRMAAAAREAGAEVALRGDGVLPVEQASFDLALSVLMLHWADDPVGELVQLRRALRPDGLMIAVLFGGQTLHELRAAFATAEAELTGGLSPRVLPMGEIRDLGGLLQRAGFAMPVADSDRITLTYDSPIHLMRDLRAMGEGNMLAARSRRPLTRALLARACQIYMAHHTDPEGRVRASFELVTLTGWAPAPDQPKPLRPGSATTRLADALGTFEIPAGEKPPRDA